MAVTVGRERAGDPHDLGHIDEGVAVPEPQAIGYLHGSLRM